MHVPHTHPQYMLAYKRCICKKTYLNFTQKLFGRKSKHFHQLGNDFKGSRRGTFKGETHNTTNLATSRGFLLVFIYSKHSCFQWMRDQLSLSSSISNCFLVSHSIQPVRYGQKFPSLVSFNTDQSQMSVKAQAPHTSLRSCRSLLQHRMYSFSLQMSVLCIPPPK